MVVDESSDILNLILIQAAAERGHGVLSVGNLVDDGGLLEATLEVLLKGLLAQGLLVLDDVVAASVASSAVASENLGTSVQVSGENRGSGQGTGKGDSGCKFEEQRVQKRESLVQKFVSTTLQQSLLTNSPAEGRVPGGDGRNECEEKDGKLEHCEICSGE